MLRSSRRAPGRGSGMSKSVAWRGRSSCRDDRGPTISLRRSPVAVVQTTEIRPSNDPAILGRVDQPGDGRVAVQRQMCTALVVVPEVLGQDPAKVVLVEHDDMIEALSLD